VWVWSELWVCFWCECYVSYMLVNMCVGFVIDVDFELDCYVMSLFL